MAEKRRKIRPLVFIVVGIGLVALAYLSRGLYYGAVTIHELLTENKHLKQAITNLTDEEQIGYAKVIERRAVEDKVFTTIRFVETARDDKLKKIMEKDCTIEGDIIHFDALIVKFGDKMVMDGKEKAIYLWRRVYGEKTPPERGLPIERAGEEPLRYNDILKKLPTKQKDMFWTSIWDLANDPNKLKQYGIQAIYGNVVYTRLTEGFVYVFKISPSGQLYPEVVPEM